MSIVMDSMELLSPAGSLEKLKYAFAYGADAAYAGIPFFSLRARENEFSIQQLREGYKIARSLQKKLYITANIFARNRKVDRFLDSLAEWSELKPDALIMSDPGLILMVRERFPEIPIHLSVQANCMNWRAVQFWQRQGISRIILSRELSLDEIKGIKDRVPEMELEAFVHGAICIAYSGRCLMSSYMSYRDANQGVCDNSCREKFNLYAVEDRRDPGQMYRIDEDENGTYIMSAKDLNLIQHLREIESAGVCSLKIEGRTKSIYYVSMVTNAYRRALDDLSEGKPFNPALVDDLHKVANRGFHKGFLLGPPGADGQNYFTSDTVAQSTRRFSGIVKPGAAKFSGFLPVEVKGRLRPGDQCELLTPQGSRMFRIEVLRNDEGLDLAQANPGGGIVHIPIDSNPVPFSLLSVV